MSKYVVTGGAGFIGSHLVERLLREGHEVLVVDDFSTGYADYLPIGHHMLTVLDLDITDWDKMTKNASYLKGAQGVFHLAAKARIQPSIKDPSITHDTNATGTKNILEMMRMLDIRNIVYSASSSYYGVNAKIPSKELDACDCQTPYSVSKYIGELYCSTWAKCYKMNSIRLRYFNVWGPRSPLSGPYAPVVSLFFRQALLENKPMTIVGDGTQKRDFTHVEDIVDANVKAIECLESSSVGGVDKVFNIGTGKNYSILELSNLVKSSIKSRFGERYKCEIQFLPKRIGEAQESLADNEMAVKSLGWEPKNFIENKINNLRDYYSEKLKEK